MLSRKKTFSHLQSSSDVPVPHIREGMLCHLHSAVFFLWFCYPNLSSYHFLSCLSFLKCLFLCYSPCSRNSPVSHFRCQCGIVFSEQAGQAGCRSVLRLKLHRRKAVCPLEHNTSHKSFFEDPAGWNDSVVYSMTDWCCAYTDEVVFREAAGCDVVLQELLGKILMHLSCLMGIHGVSTSLVQIWGQRLPSVLMMV